MSERVELAADLLASLDGEPGPDVEAAWAAEIDRRAREARANPDEGIPWETVSAELYADTSHESRSVRGGLADENLSDEQVLNGLHYPAYFDLLQMPYPSERGKILEALASDHLIRRNPAGQWDITNLGAILLAKKLRAFHGLERKAVRVVVYKGTDRTETEREDVEERGYAVGFDSLLHSITLLIPSNEVIQQALRKTVPMYPPLAVRELIANALIHQDFTVRGAGPMIELFADRLEITNPGIPLVQADRFLDQPPQSRNDGLASLMRRMGICEERGSGIDKVVKQTEAFQLPAPLFEVSGEFTRVVLFARAGQIAGAGRRRFF